MDTALSAPTGRALSVPAGGDVQAALNAAQPGDEIVLAAGAVFTGPFTLPNKRGAGWITVRTDAPERLPQPGTRVHPAEAAAMPKLEASSGSVLVAARGAHHYRFIGIEIRPRNGVFLYNLVRLGYDETSADQLPHHLIFDRCYLHGDPQKGARRGIAMNSMETAVIDSHLSDFKEAGADSQAIAGWNGAGPFKIANNYLEGAGENVLFGGSDSSIKSLVPADIEIRGNHFSKPLSWKIDDPSYAGTPWTVKNLFELKNARRVVVAGNLFERNWVHAQNGFAILLTVRNQDGGSPWSVVEDVTFMNNVVRHTASAVNILGYDNNYPSRQTRRIVMKNNLFDDVGGVQWGGGGRLFQLLDGAADVVIDHNTAFHTGHIIMAEGRPNTGFIFQNNIAPHNEYGIFGADMGSGNPALERYFPGAAVRKNVIIGGNAAQYPPDNFFPASPGEMGFVGCAGGVYCLPPASPYQHAGTDGKDPGADVSAISAVMTSVLP
ncbi:MAG: hypothetical protein HY208_05035 [Nitrospirae bacterium]|nr:hypothetical protein [Nitrospirota bacterium]